MINGGLFFFNLSSIILLFSYTPDQNIKIEFSGNNFFSAQYLTAHQKSVKDLQDIKGLINRILDIYNNAGYAFCAIAPVILPVDSGINKVVLQIDEGERVVISDYIFRVKGKTATGVLKRICRLPTDEYFSLKDLRKAKRVMLNTGVFNDISDNIVLKHNRYNLVFDLTENQSDFLSGSGSMAQNDFNFGVSYYTLNILGTLRQFRFEYESGLPGNEHGQFNSLFSLQFVEPVLLAPVILDMSFSLSTYDSARLGQLLGKVSAPVGDYFKTSVLSGIEMVDYLADSSKHGDTQSLVGVGLVLAYEAADWSTEQEISLEYLFRQDDRLRIKYDGQVRWLRIVGKPHFWWTKTSALEYFDYFRIGGSKNIRGYLEEQFVVRQALWLNLEYEMTFFYPLIDIAWIEKTLFYAYGFGINAKTDFANASLVFAWPKDANWRDGKVHFVLEKGF